MTTCSVKWVSNTKGFGFIETEKGDENIFNHLSVIIDEDFKKLTVSQSVQFDIESGKKLINYTMFIHNEYKT